MAPQIGKRYRLKTNMGNEEGGLNLVAGTEGTVLDIVPAEPGVHDGGVVIELPDRNWAAPLPTFDTTFEEIV
jgi:hypothetical protein